MGIDNIQLLQGVPPLTGDFNLDGHVNAADIQAMEGFLTDEAVTRPPTIYRTTTSKPWPISTAMARSITVTWSAFLIT